MLFTNVHVQLWARLRTQVVPLGGFLGSSMAFAALERSNMVRGVRYEFPHLRAGVSPIGLDGEAPGLATAQETEACDSCALISRWSHEQAVTSQAWAWTHGQPTATEVAEQDLWIGFLDWNGK